MKKQTKFKANTIFRGFNIALILLIIILISIITFINYKYSIEHKKKELLNNADELVTRLSNVLVVPLWNYNLEAIKKISDTYLFADYIVEIKLTDETDNIIYFNEDQKKIGEIFTKRKDIFYNQKKIAVLELKFSTHYLISAELSKFKLILIITFALAIVIIPFIKILIKLFVEKPLRNLISGILILAEGNYTHRIPTTRQKDINAIIKQINNMAEQIEKRDIEINAKAAKLEETTIKLKILIDTIKDAFFLLTVSGEIIDLNKTAIEMFDYSADDFFQLSIDQISRNLLDSGDKQFILDKINIVLNSEHTEFEWNLKRKNNEVFPAYIRLSKIEFRSEIYILAVISDISERKITEKQINEMNKKLIDANNDLQTINETKNNLIANISHELRTPLVTIRGYSELMHSGKSGETNENQKKQLSIILRNADNLESLINRLISYSTITTGKEKLKRRVFNILYLLSECAKIKKQNAQKKNIIIIENYPLKFDDFLINADYDKMKLVFLDIIENAIKFNIDGGKIFINVSIFNSGKIKIDIEDTGIGIPQSEQNKIFGSFYQVDSSSTREYGGTGVGLALCKSIIQLHGGNITVSSATDDKGACFSIFLNIYNNKIIKKIDGIKEN